MIHAHLWPAIIGVLLGAPIILLSAHWLRDRWDALERTPRAWAAGALGAFAAVYVLSIYAWFVEPNTLAARRVTIESAHWHGAPITIAALSDVHVASPHVNARRVRDTVARVNGLAPDLIVLLGDYAGTHDSEAQLPGETRSQILEGISELSELEAPFGVIGVIGNHDSWYGREQIARALRAAGVVVLWNEHAIVSNGALEFVVAGIADADTGEPDFAKALAHKQSDTANLIVLSHAPDPFVDAPSNTALMLAGHTHCGQVTIPLLGRLVVPSRYGQRFACGRVDEEGRTLFVTAGLGTSIIPARFLNPPEIALITLRSADE